MNLTLNTSSHANSYSNNRALKHALDEYFVWNKTTGFYRLFQEEKLRIDDTDGFIGILDNDNVLTNEQMVKLNNKIRRLVKTQNNDTNYLVYIGCHLFD